MKNNMEMIKIQLQLRGFEIKDTIKDLDGTLSHIYAEKGYMYYCVVAPHKGNNFSYILRRNPIITFDRWSIVDLEDFYDSAEDLLEELDYTKDLESIIIMWGSKEQIEEMEEKYEVSVN